ncbi:hypothetical protein ACFO1B_39600 [Dactylosporangium siamense]|uniref:hypothetical protein n=1 Tax=Dactylosporangium siamense TaxID=685454 RepID=UPI0019408BDD|nr:hypothetical protein [Dactylosporangium siamense]
MTGVEASYYVSFYKDWNFDKGESKFGYDLGRLAELHEYGKAQEFVVRGENGRGTYRDFIGCTFAKCGAPFV